MFNYFTITIPEPPADPATGPSGFACDIDPPAPPPVFIVPAVPVDLGAFPPAPPPPAPPDPAVPPVCEAPPPPPA